MMYPNRCIDPGQPARYPQQQRRWGQVDETAIQAEYKNGLLLVTLPKAAKAKPKQIIVNIA